MDVELSILSWNVAQSSEGWKAKISKSNLDNVITYILETKADVCCLQECSEAISNNAFIRQKYDVSQSGELAILTNTQLTVQKTGELYYNNALLANYVEINNLRLYNCHFPIENAGVVQRGSYLRSIVDHASDTPSTIICGDMNTVIPKAGLFRKLVRLIHPYDESSIIIDNKTYLGSERDYFDELACELGYTCIVGDSSTWAVPILKIPVANMKLDWFLVKNVNADLISNGPYISDHKPILVRVMNEP